MSIREWVMLIVLFGGGVSTWTIYASTVSDNKAKIAAVPESMKELKKEMVIEIKEAEERSSERIGDVKQAVQQNHKLLLEIIRGQR